jgi:hypothetical protein
MKHQSAEVFIWGQHWLFQDTGSTRVWIQHFQRGVISEMKFRTIWIKRCGNISRFIFATMRIFSISSPPRNLLTMPHHVSIYQWIMCVLLGREVVLWCNGGAPDFRAEGSGFEPQLLLILLLWERVSLSKKLNPICFSRPRSINVYQ